MGGGGSGGEHGPGVGREVGGDLGILGPLRLVLTGGSHVSFCRAGAPARSLQRREHAGHTLGRAAATQPRARRGIPCLSLRGGRLGLSLGTTRGSCLREENSAGGAVGPAR